MKRRWFIAICGMAAGTLIRFGLTAALLASGSTLGFGDHPITGRASVVDGDTIDIRGERIRLDGIDAPESWQKCRDGSGKEYPCGRVAALALDSFLAQSRPTTCHFKERDRYGRFVGTCFRADGADVNRWMVRQGHALDWKRYSKGRYAKIRQLRRAPDQACGEVSSTEPWEARRLRRERG